MSFSGELFLNLGVLIVGSLEGQGIDGATWHVAKAWPGGPSPTWRLRAQGKSGAMDLSCGERAEIAMRTDLGTIFPRRP